MEKIVVKNFGPIKELNCEIKKFTVFIGTQGSGKSTVSKLLTICRDLFWQTIVARGEDCSMFFKMYGIDTYFKPTTYIQYVKEELTITYERGKFKAKMKGCTQNVYKQLQEEMFIASLQSMMKMMGYQDINEIKDNISDMRVLIANIRTLMYIPAERVIAGQLSSSLASLIVAKVPLSDSLMEYLSFFEKAQKEFPNYRVPFLNAELHNKDGERYIKIQSEDHAELVPLSFCSSGLQSVFPMLMVVDYCVKNNYFDAFVIEEPELNLFPTNQRELVHFILQRYNDSSSKNDLNVILTTHSPYILSILNVALLAKIVAQDVDLVDDVNRIVPPNEQLSPDDIVVYALSEDDQLCCKNLMSKKTNLIGMNSLDAVSIIIGDEFGLLHQLYLKHLKK